MSDNMKNAYSYILSLDINNAKVVLKNEKKINPNNGIIYLYENYIDFLYLLINEDEVLFKDLSRNKLKRIKNIKLNDKSSPYYLYSQAEIYLQCSFISIKFGEYVRGAYEIQKAYFLLKKNINLFPDFYLNNKILGILNVLIGSIPEEYQWITNLIGMEGDVNTGFNRLNKFFLLTQENPKYTQYSVETIFLLSFLQMNISNDIDDYKILLSIIDNQYKTNKLLKLCAARLASKLGDNELNSQILNHKFEEDQTLPIYYFDYLLGMSELYKLNYNLASKHFKIFLKNFKGKNYIKSSYHKLALISFLLNDENSMQKYFNLTLLNGDVFIEEDKKAQKDVELNLLPHPVLLEARLLYDGGYYLKALNCIEKVGNPSYFSDINNIVEYWYRKARISQRIDDSSSKIIEYFSQAYNKGKELKTYFVPMAALQIGYEYEKMGNLSNAREFYKKCLEFSDFDYERGIHQKAKVALVRLNP